MFDKLVRFMRAYKKLWRYRMFELAARHLLRGSRGAAGNRTTRKEKFGPVEVAVVFRDEREPGGRSREELVEMLREVREEEARQGWRVPEPDDGRSRTVVMYCHAGPPQTPGLEEAVRELRGRMPRCLAGTLEEAAAAAQEGTDPRAGWFARVELRVEKLDVDPSTVRCACGGGLRPTVVGYRCTSCCELNPKVKFEGGVR